MFFLTGNLNGVDDALHRRAADPPTTGQIVGDGRAVPTASADRSIGD